MIMSSPTFIAAVCSLTITGSTAYGVLIASNPMEDVFSFEKHGLAGLMLAALLYFSFWLVKAQQSSLTRVIKENAELIQTATTLAVTTTDREKKLEEMLRQSLTVLERDSNAALQLVETVRSLRSHCENQNRRTP